MGNKSNPIRDQTIFTYLNQIRFSAEFLAAGKYRRTADRQARLLRLTQHSLPDQFPPQADKKNNSILFKNFMPCHSRYSFLCTS